jgi:hypothetical protein
MEAWAEKIAGSWTSESATASFQDGSKFVIEGGATYTLGGFSSSSEDGGVLAHTYSATDADGAAVDFFFHVVGESIVAVAVAGHKFVRAAPAESTSAPVETAPVETAPVETAPVETAPVETAPVEEAPPS